MLELRLVAAGAAAYRATIQELHAAGQRSIAVWPDNALAREVLRHAQEIGCPARLEPPDGAVSTAPSCVLLTESDPAALSRNEKERLTRRYTEEVQAVIGPRQDVMAPDMGTDEQTMAWIMDTYSTKVGYACPEIVTGKPVEIGGCVGRREATGRLVCWSKLRSMNSPILAGVPARPCRLALHW